MSYVVANLQRTQCTGCPLFLQEQEDWGPLKTAKLFKRPQEFTNPVCHWMDTRDAVSMQRYFEARIAFFDSIQSLPTAMLKEIQE